MDDIVKGLLDIWRLFEAAPVTFTIWAAIFLLLGDGLARLTYRKKLKLSKARFKAVCDELGDLESVLADERDELYFYRAKAGALSADIERLSAILAGKEDAGKTLAGNIDADKSAIDKQIARKVQTSVLLSATLFNRQPEHSIAAAMKKAARLDKLIFVIIYDADHPTKSNLSYALGNFLKYQSTRKLVDKSFICVLVASSDEKAKTFVPPQDTLENCRWVVLNAAGEVLRSESLSANPDEGLKRAREVLEHISALEY